jgi:hypothetical protein
LAEARAMKKLLACLGFLFLLGSTGAAQSPTAAPSPAAVAPARVVVENQQTSFFPNVDQQTGVWQGCGPPKNGGNFEDFNHTHPRARIVQVFIDASVACKDGAHTYLIVYQDAVSVVRRNVRYPMGR